MDIKISKAARKCVECGRDFDHGETMNSLVRIERRELLREDYCAACWDAARSDGAYSVWSPRYIDPKVLEQEPPEKFSPLRQLFYETVESDTRRTMAVAYLAAQLLRRQKAFRLIKESDGVEGDIRVTLFSDRIGDRLIEVSDPSLTHEEMEEGRKVLLERLAALENPPSAVEAPADAESKEE